MCEHSTGYIIDGDCYACADDKKYHEIYDGLSNKEAVVLFKERTEKAFS